MRYRAVLVTDAGGCVARQLTVSLPLGVAAQESYSAWCCVRSLCLDSVGAESVGYGAASQRCATPLQPATRLRCPQVAVRLGPVASLAIAQVTRGTRRCAVRCRCTLTLLETPTPLHKKRINRSKFRRGKSSRKSRNEGGFVITRVGAVSTLVPTAVPTLFLIKIYLITRLPGLGTNGRGSGRHIDSLFQEIWNDGKRRGVVGDATDRPESIDGDLIKRREQKEFQG